MDTKLNLAHVSTTARTSNKYFKCVIAIECIYDIKQRFGEFAWEKKTIEGLGACGLEKNGEILFFFLQIWKYLL